MITKANICENKKKKLNESEVERYLTITLLKLKIPASNKGFIFTKECAKIVYYNPIARFNMKTMVFSEVAKMFYSNPSAVERSIRHSILSADIDSLNDIFRKFSNPMSYKPSVCEFISLLVESINFYF